MLDGVNFDFEDEIPKDSHLSSLLTSLMAELYKEVKAEIPGSQVSFDTAWSPDCIDKRCLMLPYFLPSLVCCSLLVRVNISASFS
jgi:hypothetical protein